MKNIVVSDLTLRRMPKYLHFLRPLQKLGHEFTSASEISRALGIHHTQVRKDLALTGVRGIPKVGHRVDDLIKAIEEFLNWNNSTDAFLIGTGNMGAALLGYDGFNKTNIKIVAAFDADPKTIGREVNGYRVMNIDKCANLVERMHVHIAILTTPTVVAQEVTDMLVGAGILAIWNFTPIKLVVPKDVIVEDAELYSSLAVLSRKLTDVLASV
ncbi:MAG: redox-sensing transcriptional repressor Rex [Candidatus Cloacimonetes bacterium]|nr:redox-sensing transcriptional repressor Rex [Candidatus Cloacimonadota bacterium]